MIKALFFAASALLFPCLAFGGNPSADLSVQVVTLTPSGPTVPQGASTAGLNTLALNSDFTQQMPVNWVGGCAVAGNGAATNTSDTTGHTWWQNRYWSSNYQPCNIVQVTDPTYGGTVLNIPWVVDPNYGALGNNLESASWNYNPTTGAGQANTVPLVSYYEMVARADPPTLRGNYFAFWTWGQAGISGGGPSGIEWDVVEGDGENYGLYDSAIHNWSSGTGGGWILYPWTSLAPGTNFDPTKYNTYGLRVSSDGNDAIGCTYVNNVFQTCAALGGLTADEKVNRNILLITSGCNDWAETCSAGTTQHLYVKTARVWSCPTWASSQCYPSPAGTNLLGNTWTTSGTSQAAATAPNGSAAIRVTEDTSNGFHTLSQTVSLTPELYTFSENIAPGASGSRNVALQVNDAGGGYAGAIFNSSTGEVVGSPYSAGTGRGVNAGSSAISGGFKVWVTISDSAQITTVYGAVMATGGGWTGSYQGDGSSNVLVWGGQLKHGITP
jgi:hypothetical protein